MRARHVQALIHTFSPCQGVVDPLLLLLLLMTQNSERFASKASTQKCVNGKVQQPQPHVVYLPARPATPPVRPTWRVVCHPFVQPAWHSLRFNRFFQLRCRCESAATTPKKAESLSSVNLSTSLSVLPSVSPSVCQSVSESVEKAEAAHSPSYECVGPLSFVLATRLATSDKIRPLP